MKFFAQFLCYSFTLSTYLMILMAYYVHKDKSHVQWIVALSLGGFFVFFTLGMVINTMLLAALAQSTVLQLVVLDTAIANNLSCPKLTIRRTAATLVKEAAEAGHCDVWPGAKL